MLFHDAIHSHPSKQQITNLIRYRVANCVIPTYNTTNTPNKSSSHQFVCNVPCNEPAETSLFFCSFIVQRTAPLFCIQIILVLYPITIPFVIHITSTFHQYNLFMQGMLFIQNLQYQFQCMMPQCPSSIQFNHATYSQFERKLAQYLSVEGDRN